MIPHDRFDWLVYLGAACGAVGLALSPFPWLALLFLAAVLLTLAAVTDKRT
jgi:hypothetical protein